MTIHVVQPGETVASSAAGYGVDPVRRAADNSVDRGQLAVGQTLVIRFPRRVHAVQPGETLYSISQSYGVSLRQLWRNNWSLGGNTALQPGQQLVISYLDAKLGTALLNGYAYPFIDSALLAEQLPYLTDLAPFTYGITAAGGLLPLADEALISAARQHGTAPVMHLSTLTESGQFSTEWAEAILSDETMQAELIRHIRDHLLTDREGYTSLSRLAAEHEMSVSHLQKLFKQIYGVPVYHYIKEYRLEQAAVELVRSARPVTEIAQDAGYDNASKFSACFKERYGVTPSQYRTDAKAKQSIGTKTE